MTVVCKASSNVVTGIKQSLASCALDSSCHGVKYIVKSDSLFRRLVWLLFVMSCLTAVILQIVDRVTYFYSRPISVSVKINYNQSLTFPAVTICNQNAFRITRADQTGRYELIEEMFASKRTLNDSDLARHEANNLTLEELYTDLAHTKEDFIFRCLWKNRRCDATDFRMILTDHGVCYSFVNDYMSISSAGVDAGLRLTLNVEQYEYMVGPHDAAGIKILLHDPREKPFVYELGQAVPIGTHAIFGVKLWTIDNLPAPHGDCAWKQLRHTMYYSTEECYMDCLTRHAENVCGCRDIYMHGGNDYLPVCTLSKYYNCLQSLEELFDSNLRSECDCPVPCHFNIYDPSVSYSSISNQLVNKIQKSDKTSSLQSKMLLAHETSAKLDKEKVKSFLMHIQAFGANLKAIKAALEKISTSLQDQRNETETIYQEMSDVYATKKRMYRYQVYVIKKNFLRPREAMEERVIRNVVVAFTEYARLIKRRILRLANTNASDQFRKELFENIVDHLTVRQEVTELAKENITQLLNAYINGEQIFDYMFEDVPLSHNPHIVPKLLMNESIHYNSYMQKYIPKIRNTDFEMFALVFEMLLNITTEAYENHTVDEANLNYVFEQYQSACRNFLYSKSVVYDYGIERPTRVLERRREEFTNEWTMFSGQSKQLSQIINSLTFQIHNVRTHSLPNLTLILSSLNDYSHVDSVTLLDLADLCNHYNAQTIVNEIQNIVQEIHTRGQSISDLISLIELPIINIWKAIIEDEDSLDYYVFTNNTAFLRNFSGVEKEWKRKIEYVKSLDIRIHTNAVFDEFLSSYKELALHLETFQKYIVLDGNFLKENLLQLDIFYRQLSYEYINQQKAYDFIALTSDIGGAMGLFIGASMLTVLETIDLFLVHLPLFQRKYDVKQ